MKEIFERSLKVDASLTDVNVQFGILPGLIVAQDNMCEFFRNIGCDGLTMIPVCNCFFVLTKSKIKFLKNIAWLDEFKARTELVDKSKIKVVVQTDYIENGKVFGVCMHEMCAIDASDRKIRPVSTTLMAETFLPTKENESSFEKMLFDLNSDDYVYSHKINVENLDFYKHTNNLQYVHFMFSTLELDFVENNFFDEFEIHYIAESRIGDELKIYQKIEEDKVLFQINRDDKCITKAKLKYHQK